MGADSPGILRTCADIFTFSPGQSLQISVNYFFHRALRRTKLWYYRCSWEGAPCCRSRSTRWKPRVVCHEDAGAI